MTSPAASPAAFFAGGVIGPVAHEARELWLAYRTPVETGDRVHVLFEHAESRPRQGLRVLMDQRRHQLEINGQRGKGFTLWADTAPRHVEVEIAKAGRGGALVFMNVWEEEKYGTMLLGMGWCAISVRRDPDGSLVLDCSDGYGPGPSFGDLVVRVLHERADAGNPAPRPSV